MTIPKRKIVMPDLSEPSTEIITLKEGTESLLDPEEGSIEITDEDLDNDFEEYEDYYEEEVFEDVIDNTPLYEPEPIIEEPKPIVEKPIEKIDNTPPPKKEKKPKKSVNFSFPKISKVNPLVLKAGGVIGAIFVVFLIVSHFLGDVGSSSKKSTDNNNNTEVVMPEISKLTIEDDSLYAVLTKSKNDINNAIISGAVKTPEGIENCSSDPIAIKKSEKAKVKLSCDSGALDTEYKYKDFLLEVSEIKEG